MGKSAQAIVQDGILSANDGQQTVALSDSRWGEWLANNGRFRFKGAAGHFSARREIRHDNEYWYAYRRRDGVLHKAYLGKAEQLNLAHLEQVAATLAGQDVVAQIKVSTRPQRQLPSLWYSNAIPALTKVRPPTLPPNLVIRPRLSQKIDRPVTFLCAPGGFGKSTLLNAWQQEREDLQVAWATLDADDNRLSHFWTTVLLALQAVEPDLGLELLAQIRLSFPLTPADFVSRLTNEIVANHEGDFCIALVLDDYHHIQHPDIHAMMQIWIENLPACLQLVVASRARPPLALGRLRAMGAVTELELEDLRFTLDEGISFLQRNVVSPGMAYGDMEALVKRTSGWAAGLTLAVLGLNRQEDRRHFLDSFNGTHLYLREYFMETALHQQSEAVQTFLLQTSILKQLTGDLCDAVTGQAGGAQTLERLWRQNLFIVRTDEPAWYHYQDLFAEMLSEQLRLQMPEQIAELHHRAADWYRRQNASADAVRHLLAVKDFEEAAYIIEDEVLHELIEHGEDSRLLRWIQQIPESVFQHHKTLLFVYLRLAKLALNASEVERFLQRLETNLISKPDALMTADEVEVLEEVRTLRQRKMAGDLSMTPAGVSDTRWQLLDALWVVEASYMPQTEEVGRRIAEIYQQALVQGNLFVVLIAGADSASRAFLQGHLRRCEKIVYQVLQHALVQRGKLPEPASIALLLLSHLCLMRNEMAQARQFMQQATVVDPNPTSSNMPVNIAITRAKLQAALGNHEAAWSSIRAARALQAQRPSGGWRDQDLIAYEAMFRLPEGDWDEIERLLAEVGDDEHPVGLLVRAEMLLAQNQAAAAEELLQRFLDSYPNGIAAEPSLNARLLLTLALYEGHKLNQA
ncbi:MAG: hypothetical protein KDE09_07410, partial [Anaerolineales bacterium]|nr:hypothetical protein [Anaerolineales bacterium]